MCAIVARGAGEVVALYEDAEHLVSLPLYVRRWGHVLVTPKVHVTSYTAVDTDLWARTNALALRAARAVEAVRTPRRIYMASTGSSGGELVNCSEHLHVHVVPIHEPDDRPADVFSWQAGVYVGTRAELEALRDSYLTVW